MLLLLSRILEVVVCFCVWMPPAVLSPNLRYGWRADICWDDSTAVLMQPVAAEISLASSSSSAALLSLSLFWLVFGLSCFYDDGKFNLLKCGCSLAASDGRLFSGSSCCSTDSTRVLNAAVALLLVLKPAVTTSRCCSVSAFVPKAPVFLSPASSWYWYSSAFLKWIL